jgi:valyl-tRNA synthetase
MRFFPDRWAKVYDHWLGGIQDWCISRQLWWGHRVPVWSVNCEGKTTTDIFHVLDQCLADTLEDVLENKGDESVIRIINVETGALLYPTVTQFNHGLDGARVQVQVALLNDSIGAALERNGFTQDPDVLDTWFSSWLWPFATMGWPEKTGTLAKFYPTTDLVTGPDIIFFWVARMIMAGFEWMGGMPFRNVYFTGIIRDKQGRKMSKSLGNSPDPLDLIAKFGADALRFGIMRSAPQGQDLLFDEKQVELGRNFCNKLWNACRFRQMQGIPQGSAGFQPASEAAGGTSALPFEFEGEINPALLTSDDKWILLRLDAAIREITAAFDEYRFSEVASVLHRFFWSEYCDWFVEASKAVLQGSAGVPPANTTESTSNAGGTPALPSRKANKLAVIDFVLGHTLRLLHPFLPFITEELWQGMGFNGELPADQGGRTIMRALWPVPFDEEFKAHYGLDETAEKLAAAKYQTVEMGRNLRGEFNIASNKRVRFVLKPAGQLAPEEAEVLRLLLNAEPLDVLDNYAAPKGTPTVLTPLGELYLPLEGLIDVEAERARLAKEIAKVEAELVKVRTKLADENFTAKVPAKVLDEHKQRETNWAEKLVQLKKMRDTLG